MSKTVRRATLATLLLASAGMTQAQEQLRYSNASDDTTPSASAMMVDLAVSRPLGLVATVLGTAVFVVGLPFEAMAGNIKGPAKRLVVEPAQFTFTRRLGEAN